MTDFDVDEVAERCDRIVTEIERAIVGKRRTLELVLIGFLADGRQERGDARDEPTAEHRHGEAPEDGSQPCVHLPTS